MRTMGVLVAWLCLACVACGGSSDGDNVDAAVSGPDGSSSDGGGREPLLLTFESMLPELQSSRGFLTMGAGGELFSMRDNVVARSTDRGVTWQERATLSGSAISFAHDGVDALYASGRTNLWRSRDGAQTFTELSLPVAPDPVYPFRVRTTNDGVLWLASATGRLFRSIDRGDSFQEVTLPDTYAAIALQPTSLDGCLYVIADESSALRTCDGGQSWLTLGVYARVFAVTGFSDGVVLMSVRDDLGMQPELRSIDNGVTWSSVASSELYYYLPRTADVIRVSGTARVQSSANHGESWTDIVSAAPSFFVSDVIAFDDELIGSSTNGFVRVLPGATSWSSDAPAGLPHPAVGRYRDVAFGSGGKVVLAGYRQIFLSNDDGETFALGKNFSDDLEIGELSCVAMRPDGERIFVGSSLLRFEILQNDAMTSVYTGVIPERTGETISQASWIYNPGSTADHLLFVSTASDDFMHGIMLQSVPEDDRVSWNTFNPLVVVDAPNNIRGASYYGFAITAQGRNNIVSFVGVRERVAVNLIQDWLYVNLEFPSGPWMSVERPVAFGHPMSISARGVYGQSVAFVYPDNRLFVGAFSNFLQQVPLTNVLGDLLVAKFDPNGKLWLVTTQGVYRSTTELP